MDDDKKQNCEQLEASGDPSSAVSDVANPEDELLRLREQLEIKEKEAQTLYDRLIRQAAEIENFKKRSARERDDAIRFANEYLIKDLLPVLDNLERAVVHAGEGGNGGPLAQGVELVLKGFFDVLSKHGVVQVSAIGQPFDPEIHEAMAQVESDEHAPNTVVAEHHKGYFYHDRLIRPALVSVTKASITKENKNGGGKVENGPSDD